MSAEKFYCQWAGIHHDDGFEDEDKKIIALLESYASHERESILNVSEEEIEQLVTDHGMEDVKYYYTQGAKALLNHLKQNR